MLSRFPALLIGFAAALTAQTGAAVPEFAPVDRDIQALMDRHGVAGGAIAIVKDGLVFARGYGVADVANSEPVQPNSLFYLFGVISGRFGMYAARNHQVGVDATVFAYSRIQDVYVSGFYRYSFARSERRLAPYVGAAVGTNVGHYDYIATERALIVKAQKRQRRRLRFARLTAGRVGSISKTITAVSLLHLYEAGRLDLDAKVYSEILTQLQPPAGAKVDPRIWNITVRQLLHHAGGHGRECHAPRTPFFPAGREINRHPVLLHRTGGVRKSATT